MKIFVDADGCAVKDEIYKVADRHKLIVVLVANNAFRIPNNPLFSMHVVSNAFDAADDWIVENAKPNEIVVTSDILLADRCIKKSIKVINNKGEQYTEDNIGSMVAGRQLMENLRHMGEMRGGPAPMDQKSRSRFLGTLEQVIQGLKKKK